VKFTKARPGRSPELELEASLPIPRPCPDLVPTRVSGHPSDCPQTPAGPSAALLTWLPRHLRRPQARGLRLLGVEVLGLCLLAPRHSERRRYRRSLRVSYFKPRIPGVRKFHPSSPSPPEARKSWQFCCSAERGDLSTVPDSGLAWSQDPRGPVASRFAPRQRAPPGSLSEMQTPGSSPDPRNPKSAF
jgi:hypothetical protein